MTDDRHHDNGEQHDDEALAKSEKGGKAKSHPLFDLVTLTPAEEVEATTLGLDREDIRRAKAVGLAREAKKLGWTVEKLLRMQALTARGRVTLADWAEASGRDQRGRFVKAG
jgi:hypothetical protein